MARHVAMSVRHFSRVFRDEVGIAPATRPSTAKAGER
jgi:transcriptional regulator GlxA family with amidase domain